MSCLLNPSEYVDDIFPRFCPLCFISHLLTFFKHLISLLPLTPPRSRSLTPFYDYDFFLYATTTLTQRGVLGFFFEHLRVAAMVFHQDKQRALWDCIGVRKGREGFPSV